MAESVGREYERHLLRADHKRLHQLLGRIAADIRTATELAASVQQRLAEELAEQRRVKDDGSDEMDPELASALASLDRLRLQLLIEPSGDRAAVDLPLDATVADLQAAVLEAGGPIPVLQVLAVGGERLLCLGSTPLSETRLIRQDVWVTVRRRDPRRRSVDVGMESVYWAVLLESGEVWCSMRDSRGEIASNCVGKVQSVHCGAGFVATIADGKLEGCGFADWTAVLQTLGEREIVCCSADRGAMAVVDSGGQLFGFEARRVYSVPSTLDGRVAAVSIEGDLLAVLTRDGEVCTVTIGDHAVHWRDLGGRAAVAVSAGRVHCAALLDDGSVRCFGDNGGGQCDVPFGLRDVVSVECFMHTTLALQANGRVTWWGSRGTSTLLDPMYKPPFPSPFNAGPCVAIAADPHGLLTVSADGRLVHYEYGSGREDWSASPPGTIAGP